MDASIKPIANATVTLTASARTALTDANGLFGFDDLEAQTCFLQAEKRGYSRTQQSVDVVAGIAEPAIVKILLTADPSTLAFVVQHTYEGYIQCGFKVAMFVLKADAAWAPGHVATPL